MVRESHKGDYYVLFGESKSVVEFMLVEMV